jgi:hypothetical protein
MAKSNAMPLVLGAAAVFLLLGSGGNGSGTQTGGETDENGKPLGQWDETRDAPRVIDRLNSIEITLTQNTSKMVALTIAHDLFPDFPQDERAAVDYTQTEPGRGIWQGVTATIQGATGITVPALIKRTGTRDVPQSRALALS